MPSNKVKSPAKYLLHWHSCLAFLAARDGDGEVMICQELSPGHRRTVMNKLRSMRESVRMYPGWPGAIRAMVLRGELHFETRGVQVWAIRRPQSRTLEEILRTGLKK